MSSCTEDIETVDLDSIGKEAADRLDLRDLEVAGSGLEFCVFRGIPETGDPVALRIPRRSVYRTPGEIPLPARRLQDQEFLIYRLLHRAGLPVPRPLGLIEIGAQRIPVLMSRYVDSDGRGPDSSETGRFLAEVHGFPIPRIDMVDHERESAVYAIDTRIRRRWGAIRANVPDLPVLPPPRATAALLAPLAEGPLSLLHMDVRSCNLLSNSGVLAAAVDWSSSLLSHPAVEFARMREYAQLEENGLDLEKIIREYRRHLAAPRVDAKTEAFLRLDTATMLTLVFVQYAPDPVRAAWVIDRLFDLTDSIGKG